MTKIKLTYKTIITLMIGISLLTGSCTQQNPETELYRPVNYIVLLDLSDRILVRHVTETDQLLIQTVFQSFVGCVRQNLTVRSVDKLKVRIMPQKGSTLDLYSYENRLSIDMSALDVSMKNNALVNFDKQLATSLASLYREAYQGPATGNYFGCDIWKYFNEQLRTDLEHGYINYVIILTDGYFDFENSAHALRKGNRFTSSDFYAGLSSLDWQVAAAERDFGLIPIDLKQPVHCLVCGLNSKKEQLTELEKLGYFWKKWMLESHADTCILIPFSSSEKMKHELVKQIKTVKK
ncbi:MAG: hypothetical protein ISS19_09630 [Bacteroidales bacterium]|nr:hypothetical protein [Bacteroidales bacterium]